MENIIEQDICKGYSIVAIEPKGDIELFSKTVQVAFETGRHNDLMLITHVFLEYSTILDPLSSYYMIERLVAKAGGAGVYILGYYQSISRLYAEFGLDRANIFLTVRCRSRCSGQKCPQQFLTISRRFLPHARKNEY